MTKQTANQRRGTTVLEIVAAGAVLGVLLIVCAQMLSRTAVQQQAIANRRAALQMAANAMERARTVPWEELDAASTERIARAVVDQEMLRGGRVDIAVDEPESSFPAKRVRAIVSWKEERDGVERKQELTAWRFAERSPEPAGATAAGPSTLPEEEQ